MLRKLEKCLNTLLLKKKKIQMILPFCSNWNQHNCKTLQCKRHKERQNETCVIQAENRLNIIVDDNLTHNYNDNNNCQIMRLTTA